MKQRLVLMPLLALLSLVLIPDTAAAQKKKTDNKGNEQEKVVYVDDEACGCELVFIDGIQTIERNGKFGFKREDGTVFVEPIYKFVDKFHGDYCIVYYDYDSCGLIDRNGRTIVPVQYQEVNYPTDGMIRVRKGDYYGFYDTAGHQVIDFHYRTASGFSEGLAVVIIDFDSNTIGYGYINKKDSLAISAKYEYALAFSEGYAIVKQYDRFGMIDHNGREVLTIKYLEVTPMLYGHFFAVDEISEKAALFDNHFRRLTPFIYEKVQSYSEEFYTVMRDGKYTYLDFKGKEHFGFYDIAAPFYEGYAMVSRDRKYGIINNRGKVILPIEYDNSGYRTMEYVFAENLAMVEKDGRYGFVNKSGKIVIPLIYESTQHCTEGLIPVQKDGIWGYIDKEGNAVSDFVYDIASFFEYGRAEVVYQGTVYKINPDGVCVKNCKTYPKNLKFKFND